MLNLNIIGAGKLGSTLARLWQEASHFRLQDICNTTLASATSACEFSGAGRPHASLGSMRAADVWLLATPDDQLETAAAELARSGLVGANHCVFHCSGAAASDILLPLSSCTHLLASIHPAHSFASPSKSVQTFAGSYCAHEGNDAALQRLLPAFSAIGARLISIRAADKVLYHAASVIACNYLVTLLDGSLQCLDRAGIDPEAASRLLLPLVHQTVDNALQNTPQAALTGPIARGDSACVARQLAALQDHSAPLAELYLCLGRQTLALASRGQPDNSNWLAMSQTLNRGEQV